jgi:hypothetical protein
MRKRGVLEEFSSATVLRKAFDILATTASSAATLIMFDRDMCLKKACGRQ